MLFINFNEINEFFKNTNCKYGSEIVKCCKGKKEFSGELQDGTPMKWTYLSDCNKQMLEKLLEKETNELKIYLVKEELKKFEDLEYEKSIDEKNQELMNTALSGVVADVFKDVMSGNITPEKLEELQKRFPKKD